MKITPSSSSHPRRKQIILIFGLSIGILAGCGLIGGLIGSLVGQTTAQSSPSVSWRFVDRPASPNNNSQQADQENLNQRRQLLIIRLAENLARSYNAQIGDDGTYRQASEDIAAIFGITIDYNFQNLYQYCSGTNLAEEETFAAFCPTVKNKIFVNSAINGFSYAARTMYYPSAIRHEMAHFIIGEICAGQGGIMPAIAGHAIEAVTSSFAVLFLGADRNQLNSVDNAEYQMTTNSDLIAIAIHDQLKCQ
jgi:hypothetical protein